MQQGRDKGSVGLTVSPRLIYCYLCVSVRAVNCLKNFCYFYCYYSFVFFFFSPLPAECVLIKVLIKIMSCVSSYQTPGPVDPVCILRMLNIDAKTQFASIKDSIPPMVEQWVALVQQP